MSTASSGSSGSSVAPSAGLPSGLLARRPVPADAQALHALVVACDVAVTGGSDATPAQTAADLAAPAYDRDRAGIVVERAGGNADGPLGWLWTEDDVEAGVLFVDPYSLDPALIRWLLARAVEHARILAAERGTTIVLDAGSFEHDTALAAALQEAGLSIRRRFWRMLVDLTGPGAAAHRLPPTAPHGVTVHRPCVDEHTYLLLHRLVEGSFAEHWDHTKRSYPDWRQRFDASAGLDPDQWWVADVDGEPAGLLIGDESRADVGRAWVRTLGVLPAHRGRGVAKTLLRTAFAHAAARGRTGVGLSVDSENATGAIALYESVGMRTETVLLAWKGEVRPPPG